MFSPCSKTVHVFRGDTCYCGKETRQPPASSSFEVCERIRKKREDGLAEQRRRDAEETKCEIPIRELIADLLVQRGATRTERPHMDQDFIQKLDEAFPVLAEALRLALDALEELSALGNGTRPGNSIGNEIAQKALSKISSSLNDHS